MKINLKSILALFLIVGIIIFFVSYLNRNSKKTETLTYKEVIEMIDNDLVQEVKINGKLLMSVKALKPELNDDGSIQKDTAGNPILQMKDGKPVTVNYEYQISYTFQMSQINDKLTDPANSQNLTEYNVDPAAETSWFQAYLPYILVSVLFAGLWIFILRQSGGGMGKMNSFSRSHAKVSYNEKNAVKFADVAGADEEKAELEELVDFLKDPVKYTKLGARIPRGVLLVGPPGTGKTLLAKAVAGEAGVPFFSISGSDFVEMYVGVGASRVRDLFDSARRVPASIIFIDEIDAVGRHRGAGLGGGHDEREQTLNQLLVEMDGFGTNSGVIVIAATNRPDILDPALLRPGRFDRRVTVSYPDMKGREEILRVHCRNKPLEGTVDLEKIAQVTIGFTGAELANLMNEAALHAAKFNKALIGMDDIDASFMKLILGPQKKVNRRTEEDNKLCAYHEAGHAVASYYCKHTDPVKHITIVPAGNAGGVTVSRPTKDTMATTKGQMLDQIVLALGGRCAEELILEDISTGASSDIQQATGIARAMVTRYGMSEKLGTVLYGSEHSEDEVFLGRDFSSGKNYSEKTAALIDEEIQKIVNDSYARCKEILSTHADKLHFIAEFLLKFESMDEEQFIAAMESENPTIEEIDNIKTEKKKNSDRENELRHEQNAKAEAEERARAEEAAKAEGADNGALNDDVFEELFGKKPEDHNDDSENK